MNLEALKFSLPNLHLATESKKDLSENKSNEDWLLQRKGRFTASEIHKLMTVLSKPNELPTGASSYIIEKVAEALTDGLPDTFTSDAMQWGKDHEIEAINLFCKKTKLKIRSTGNEQKFINYGKHAGCTPDGLGVGYGVETKCPKSSTHVVYKSINNSEDLKRIKPEYYWQIQFSMLCAKKSKWYFISYDPRFSKEKQRLHYAVIERNESDIALLKQRLELAIAKKIELIKNFN